MLSLKKIVNYFKGNSDIKDFESIKSSIDTVMNKKINIEIPKLNSSVDKKKKNILIMDDSKGMVDVIKDDLVNISKLNNPFDLSNYNLIEASGIFAAFSVRDFLVSNKIDIAILDISIGGVVFNNGINEELDEVDIAHMIISGNPKARIVICSGHTLNRKNPEIYKFINKFNSNFDRDISEYYVNKNSHTRPDKLVELLCSK